MTCVNVETFYVAQFNDSGKFAGLDAMSGGYPWPASDSALGVRVHREFTREAIESWIGTWSDRLTVRLVVCNWSSE